MSASTRDASGASSWSSASAEPEPTPTGVPTSRLPTWHTTVPPRSPRRRRRTAVRALALVLAAVVAIVLLAMVVAAPRGSGLPLDPDDTGHGGAHAVAEVLRQHDVDVSVVRGIDELERTLDSSGSRTDWTVVLTDASYLGHGAAERLSLAVEQTRRLVLVEPDDVELDDLDVPLTVIDRGTSARAAGCTSDVADPTDRLTASWSSYAVLDEGSTSGPSSGSDTSRGSDASGPAGPSGDDATLCFRPAGHSPDATDSGQSGALVLLPAQDRAPETVVLGSQRAMSNGQVLADAHAAMALRALGPSPHLLWYVPGLSDLDAVDASGDHVADPGRGTPAWLEPAAWLLTAAMAAFALARGRRLGRPVAEPLPVVVRAAETTEARGRLYHRAADRPRAAHALRVGSRTRLADRLGLPRSTPVTAVVDAAARTSGTARPDVEQLLDGPDPTTDRDLLLLAQRLAQIEESVRKA